MKALFFLGLLATLVAMTPARQQEDGLEQLRTCIADHFSVNSGQVLLASPNVVYVSTLGGTLQGTASFVQCGSLCTEVYLQFVGDQFLCIVEDDLGFL